VTVLVTVGLRVACINFNNATASLMDIHIGQSNKKEVADTTR